MIARSRRRSAVRVPSFEAAEHSAAAHMRSLGYRDARVTQRGSDGGIDVIASQAVAQVKWHMTPVGRPDIQKLYGARGTRHHLDMLFFAAVGFSAQAIQCADELGVALLASYINSPRMLVIHFGFERSLTADQIVAFAKATRLL
ncbi:restriction endonuclease [Nocardia nepalensis]|uniref:restriction endonuclease n=1 Tax=Nocardia nepalensis TaxID=3375448 RepID=UPI003B684E12